MARDLSIELLVVLPEDTAIDRGRAFEIACGPKPGFRMRRVEKGIEVVLDGTRIERLGPVVEAAAIVSGASLLLRHPDGDLAVPMGSDLDARPSGVWAAIGDAFDEAAVAAERGDDTGDPFRHVSAQRVDGVSVAIDGRAPRIEPMDNSLPWEEGETTKYDDLDWQDVDTGSPRDVERAFVHIGLYLGWLIRRDLHEPSAFSVGWIDSIKLGGAASGLISHVDQKLTSNLMSSEGRAFSDAHYRAYLRAFERLYPDIRRRRDDDAARSRVDPVLDQLYADWVAAGRPDDLPDPRSEDEQDRLDDVFRSMKIDWAGIRKAEARKRGTT